MNAALVKRKAAPRPRSALVQPDEQTDHCKRQGKNREVVHEGHHRVSIENEQRDQNPETAAVVVRWRRIR